MLGLVTASPVDFDLVEVVLAEPVDVENRLAKRPKQHAVTCILGNATS